MSTSKVKEKRQTKVTNEKPVSLHPLDFKQALAALIEGQAANKEKRNKQARQLTAGLVLFSAALWTQSGGTWSDE